MKIFNPIISLMNRLTYFHKFNFIGLFLGIPIIILTFILLTNLNEEVNGNLERHKGAKYNQLLKNLLQDVQQHRGITVSFLNGDKTFEVKMKDKQTEIVESFHAIKQYDQLVGKALNTTDSLTKLDEEWQAIVKEIDNMTAMKAFEIQNEYIISLTDMIINNADSSQLYLSSKEYMYYMINDLTKTLPNLTESLGQMRALGMNVLSKHNMSEAEKTQFISLTISIKQALKDLEHGADVTFSNNPSLKKQYEKENEVVISGTNSFLEFVSTQFIQENKHSISPEEFFSIATATIDSSFYLFDLETVEFEKMLDQQIKESKMQRLLIVALITIVFILTVYSSIGFFLSIRNTITELQRVSKNLANGDLTEELSLNTKDEMKNVEAANNQMIHGLRSLISQINKSAEYLTASSEELTSSAEQTGLTTEQVAINIQEIAAGSTLQMQSVENISAKINELATGIHGIVASGDRMNTYVNDTSKRAKSGEDNINKAINQINVINATFENLTKTVHSLSDHSDGISQIVKVITDIANQTNLLALNAAIEAARAGENGKGFAIVADEVRKLAEQSSQSANQIAELITSMQEVTKNTVHSMDFARKEVTEGMDIVHLAGKSFGLIGQSVTEMTTQMEEVSTAVHQMSYITDQVVQSISLILEVAESSTAGTQTVSAATEEQLASMEEVMASAVTLSKMAEELYALVKKFKL